ncbi:pro-neuregulin- membrane-bound hypothetical protein [Limosa lapponica baueri]|uniref:Neuregulin C-terminal domain-containing protein n=2 Tax=Limosa lapponica baueri TaxID=1758121 RepID=A0A2I0TCS5_LIMLA|nr:pro-neuregulin- membrane-bound hypothetical protein [Limosa lapponica baueri]
MIPTSFQFNYICPSMVMRPFMKEERLMFLVTPRQLWEKYDHQLQQVNSYHHSSAYQSNNLPSSLLRILEDEEYAAMQEYEPAQEPLKKLTNSQSVKRTKPTRVEIDSDTSSDSSSSVNAIEDETTD